MLFNKQRGLGQIIDPSCSSAVEVESFACCHCGAHTWVENNSKVIGNVVTEKKPLAARCTCCDKLMCLACVGKGCVPLERWLERQEARRSYDECAR